MTKKTSFLLIAVGVTALLLAGGLQLYRLASDYYAGKRAHEVLARMRAESQVSVTSEIESSMSPAGSFDKINDTHAADNSLPETIPQQFESSQASAPEQPSAENRKTPVIPDYSIVGVLLIPSLGLELPVLNECTKTLLNISICKYTGSASDRPERLVIAGHNYKSHFGKLSKLVIGSEVIFENTEGIQYRYAVSEIMDIDGYDQLTLASGIWDISLFTCTTDGALRTLVRCRELS